MHVSELTDSELEKIEKFSSIKEEIYISSKLDEDEKATPEALVMTIIKENPHSHYKKTNTIHFNRAGNRSFRDLYQLVHHEFPELTVKEFFDLLVDMVKRNLITSQYCACIQQPVFTKWSKPSMSFYDKKYYPMNSLYGDSRPFDKFFIAGEHKLNWLFRKARKQSEEAEPVLPEGTEDSEKFKAWEEDLMKKQK
jgi:hypothetical protein